MPRLPGNLPRGTLAAQAAHHGRAFTDAIRRDKAAELKMFAANLRAARAGPPPKKYTPPPGNSMQWIPMTFVIVSRRRLRS